MVSSPLIKLIVLSVMSVHSLFGCGIHAVHEEYCLMEEAGCQGKSCAGDKGQSCSEEKDRGDSCRCHAHRLSEEVAEVEAAESQMNQPEQLEKSVSRKSPPLPPCQCACNGSHCVFVIDAVKPILIDRFFPGPSNTGVLSVELLSNCFTHQMQYIERHTIPQSQRATACAVSQVWLL